MFNPVELILKKQSGKHHSDEELSFLINAYAKGLMPDYQFSAWLMSVFFKGMNEQEVSQLITLYKDSSATLKLNSSVAVDKHSTGGVGDKTSLLVAPIVAACGLDVPMITGRGLGHTGGTLDKLDSIEHFNTQISLEEMTSQVKEINVAVIGQTPEICPLDKKIYALRDVTGTVASIPLICASILSKKACEDLKALVLDVKFGSGAFMQNYKDSKRLAIALKKAGEKFGMKITALLTNMNQPLGRFSGNALEVKECFDILNNQTCIEKDYDFYQPTKELSLQLSAHMLSLTLPNTSVEQGYKKCKHALESGLALQKFNALLVAQGCKKTFLPNQLPQAKCHYKITSTEEGFVESINTRSLGFLNIALGAGRKAITDKIDYAVGFEMHCYIGQYVKKGQSLMRLHLNKEEQGKELEEQFRQAFQFSKTEVQEEPLIKEIL
ncbi:MAG: thymidine phosphorylase [Bdellovibrionaceae bacterium]|nr:thymidine phosphorylase [Pseudobdellovibrionaceae bacterium]